MTALTCEVSPVADDADDNPVSELDEVLWRTWKVMELPEGHRAEIIEGSIEASPTGRRRHSVIVGRLLRALNAHLAGSDDAAHNDANVIHQHSAWIPDVFVAPVELDEIPDEEGLGVDAAGISTIVEVVSPGQRNIDRDRLRKRREYARAGIPLYVLIDDFGGDGAVTLLAGPDPKKEAYEDEHRIPYGTEAVIPSGPAKGLVIGKEIVGGK